MKKVIYLLLFSIILLSSCSTKKNMQSQSMFSQKGIIENDENSTSKFVITGKIIDCEGEALIGVSITEKGKKGFGSITNVDGYYKIAVSDTNVVLMYNYIGFESQEIKVGNKKEINVSLKEAESSVLDEVEITAKGKQKKQTIVAKPVIYLYPEKKTEVSLKLEYKGDLLYTYPEYDKGWNVVASPNGVLKNKTDNMEYSYLFWDGNKQYNEQERTFNDGFVIHRDAVVEFLQETLSKLGLKPHEYNEFIVYWIPYLKKNEWSFIHFRVGENYNVISKNIVTPKPDTSIRIFMDFKGVKASFDVEPQEIAPTPIRKGFTLVEWGGSEIKEYIRIKGKDGEYLTK